MARLHIAPDIPPAPSPRQPERLPQPQPRSVDSAEGIDVREQKLGVVKAQSLYQMRCECGRSWFELELPVLVRCPACAKLSAVMV